MVTSEIVKTVYGSAKDLMKTVVDIAKTAADFDALKFARELKTKTEVAEHAQKRVTELTWAYENGTDILPNTPLPTPQAPISESTDAVSAMSQKMGPRTITVWQKHPPPPVFSIDDARPIFEKQWKVMLASEGQVQFRISYHVLDGAPYSFVTSASPATVTSQEATQAPLPPADTAATTDGTPPDNTAATTTTTTTTTIDITTTNTKVVPAVFFSATGQDRTVGVRPSLLSFGRLKMRDCRVGENEAGYGKLVDGPWDVSGVQRITLTVEFEFSSLAR